jgi:hypothetical protein
MLFLAYFSLIYWRSHFNMHGSSYRAFMACQIGLQGCIVDDNNINCVLE